MKRFCLILLLYIYSLSGYSQTITTENFEANFNTLLANMDKEDWEITEKLSSDLLRYADPKPNLDLEAKGLRYMYIYSVAGLLNEKKLSKEKALEKIKPLKGKEMIMRVLLFNSNCYINCVHLDKDRKDTFFSGVNNNAGTQIFSFEYVTIKNGISESEAELEGKYISLRGKLNEIFVEGTTLPHFKLFFTEGTYEFMPQ
ncbi:hypothetical protein E6C50_07075 [Flavobacterium supellecticarium]|uniref:DUF4919 domain-containing protein n=1 Tax=Flavobacterium supellecticarium TaxID=2565924 RepID=A0A4S4A012_9FLAO|nr:hypothetical protein [Flavobacterium supellecticarium]THF51517.1 hypothetical protein E6C50_07075 [Flavobacterium supellecticarium]